MLASQKAAFFLAKLNKADLEVLRELLEAGKLRSVVDDVFPFEQVANALEHQGGGIRAARSQSRCPTLDGRLRGRAP